ncbi:LisH domain-containing protein ARMC9 [Durusdinium trenchii]|uniref:LisH domain-containing protein ARMC9 n=1 Tax=Durusdinium trenchii TaxID=1381693 RepID=A0ABP0K1H4_9DINO
MAGPARVESAILEYLRYYEYVHTAECLEAESQQRALGRGSGAAEGGRADESRDQVRDALDALESGDADRFFYLWDTRIDHHDRQLDLARRLEFDLRVFFAVWPWRAEARQGGQRRDDNAESELLRLQKEGAMASLKLFLDQQQDGPFAEDERYCAFYALPHCRAPQSHPVFRELFEDAWAEDLKHQTDAFLRANVKVVARPALCAVLDGDAPVGTSSEAKLPDEVHDSREEAQEGKTQHPDRQEPTDMWFVKNLYATAVIAVENLERARRMGGDRVQRAISDKFMSNLLRRMDVYSQVLDGTFQGELKEHDPGLLETLSAAEKDQATPLNDVEEQQARETNHLEEGKCASAAEPPEERLEKVKPARLPMSPQSPCVLGGPEAFQQAIETPVVAPLNFAVVKGDLRKLIELADTQPAAERQACLLLQALRWRLSRTPSSKQRATCCSRFVKQDLLDLEAAHDLLRLALGADSIKLQEYALRLVYYMAMSNTGRSYFERFASFLVDWLFQVLDSMQWKFPKGTSDSFSDTALALLQRLSMHDAFCAEIISRGHKSLQDLIDFLGGSSNRSRYANEHVAALALNLALQPKAAQDLSNPEDVVIRIENVLSEKDLRYLHPYMVGVLYALLRNEDVAAILGDTNPDRGLVHLDLLKELTKSGSPLGPEERKQIFFIVDLITSGTVEQTLAEDEQKVDTDEVAEQDIGEDLAPEIEEDELSTFRAANCPSGERQGENLLVHAYLATAAPCLDPSEEKRDVDDGRKSPVMKLIDNLTLPDELLSKPLLAETAREDDTTAASPR